MISDLASVYTSETRRPLTRLLDLPSDVLPGGGNFYPEEDVLILLAGLAAARRLLWRVSVGFAWMTTIMTTSVPLRFVVGPTPAFTTSGTFENTHVDTTLHPLSFQ